MKSITEDFSLAIEKITSIPAEYIKLLSITIIGIVIINLIRIICLKLYRNNNNESRSLYLYNQKLQIVTSIIIFVFVLLVWEDYLKNIMTLISFISAGIAIALRDIIINFFAGIYIKVNKPFILEDRIEVNGLKGDVVNLKASSFEILEVGERVNSEQSTGRIIHIPNSVVFSYPIKNYVKAFKYIWHEITVKITLDSDIQKTKDILYDIVYKNDILNDTPAKMENQINSVTTDYRIYFNNLDPIIYTAIVNTHVELYIRYLVHPKKVRTVEDAIWLDILDSYKNNEIKLYTEQ